MPQSVFTSNLILLRCKREWFIVCKISHDTQECLFEPLREPNEFYSMIKTIVVGATDGVLHMY